MKRLLPILLVAGLVAAVLPPPAHAQTTGVSKPDPKPYRRGLVLGAAMGVSKLTAGFGNSDFGGPPDTSVSAATADLQFGGMLQRRIGLLFHLNLARGSEGAFQSLQAAALVGTRMFVTPVFWFEIALGTSGFQKRDTIEDRTLEEHAHSFAWMLGGGIEFYQGERFTIDVRVNMGNATYQNEFSAKVLQGLIGLNWY